LGNRELSFNDVIAPEYRELLWEKWREMLKEGKFFRHEYEIITAEGTRKWVLELGQGIADAQGGIEALEGIINDITKEKKAMLALKYVTEHDYLTGAYNRRFLRQLLSKEDSALGKRKRAVIVLVLNKLEALSLTYGQLFSESVIKELGNKLLAAVGEDKRLFRIAAGSFAFFVEDYRRLAELKDFCKELLAVMEEMPIMRIVGGSIGVMPIKATCPDTEKLLRSANAAAAKAAESEDVFAYRFVDERLLKEINRGKL
jgi:GGDEF domain-containing protein